MMNAVPQRELFDFDPGPVMGDWYGPSPAGPMPPPPPPPPPPPVQDTRRAARQQIQPHTGRMLDAVFSFIRQRGLHGATDAEICQALNLQTDTGRARRCELRDAGQVTDSGRTRATPSGRQATVWIAADGMKVEGEKAENVRREGGGKVEAAPPSGEKVKREVPADRRGAVQPSPGACRWCKGKLWWRSVYNIVVCARCHPPALPELVVEWVEGGE